MVGKIATGEIEVLTTEDGKNAAAMALGRMGGKARRRRHDGQETIRDRQEGRPGIVDWIMKMEDCVALIDARQVIAPRGPYKKRDAEIENSN